MRQYVLDKMNTSQRVWETFRYFRSEIQYEHGMLMGRVSWFITCQSFLVAAFTVSYTRLGQANWFSNVALPLLAIVISVLAYFMIDGAVKTIEQWNDLRRQLVRAVASTPHGLDPVLIPRWRSAKPLSNFTHTSALLFPRLIPFVFVTFWGLVALGSKLHPWIQVQPQ